MKLSDEQVLDALKAAGHQEAATALEQKMNAEAAAGGGADPPGPSRMPDEAVHGTSRISRAYGDRLAAEEGADS